MKNLTEHILSKFNLNDDQKAAARETERDVVVTAGAGSGKTSTLVARFTLLLAAIQQPRRIAAITFTKKAAREMRSRVRKTLTDLQESAAADDERQLWNSLLSQMDGARIGTIHSLCSEILRSHPAEAAVDPRFEIMEESISKAWMIQAVEDTLKGLVEHPRYLPLLRAIPTTSLKAVLTELLSKRLDALPAFDANPDPTEILCRELAKRMAHPVVGGKINELQGIGQETLEEESKSNFAEMVEALLAVWEAAQSALAAGDPYTCIENLYKARQDHMVSLGKNSSAKNLIKDLRGGYDSVLNPWIGGKNTKGAAPSPESESQFTELRTLLREAFSSCQETYTSILESQQALDFDDLEEGALQLLRKEEIRKHWREELDAVLVDEFQDTNDRQREIVRSLTRDEGKLFIVGDMRQSIYRFRGADVTVFNEEQNRIQQAGGRKVELKLTYRAHEPLLKGTEELLAGVNTHQADPDKPFLVPFTPMTAFEKSVPNGFVPPHLEMIFGVGEDAQSAQAPAARALIERLLQLREENQISRWDDVTLLFRASTGFADYEEALEDAGIPFVTVAGKGFYDRPEIRDILNILRALADPADNLAFAGLLRSPAFGLSDAALLLLRKSENTFWNALLGDLSFLDDQDRVKALRTRQIVTSLLMLVDRMPVAELLKNLVSATDYRAILACADVAGHPQGTSQAGSRLLRNLDKLIEDAQIGQQISVREFLDLLKVLNESGTREGEAAAEADGSVRLMTIHKAKGLEFKVVVLADASRKPNTHSESVIQSEELGVTFKTDPPTLLYQLAKLVDKEKEDAEDLRILYVAMTRAKCKLLINGHATLNKKEELKFQGWSQKLIDAAGINPASLMDKLGEPLEHTTPAGHALRVWITTAEGTHQLNYIQSQQQISPEDPSAIPLYHLKDTEKGEALDPDDIQEQLSKWLATRQEEYIPGSVLGEMIHKAIRLRVFPGDDSLMPLLETAALNAGLASEKQRQNAIHGAVQLLERLKHHTVLREIDNARELYQEVPYSFESDGKTSVGVIDLLLLDEGGWLILEFKSDPIRSEGYRAKLLEKYTPQVQRYQRAVKQLMGVEARARLCFLDAFGRVELVDVPFQEYFDAG